MITDSPVIWVSEDFLEFAHPAFVSIDGDVMTLRGNGRTAVYVIDRASYDPVWRTYRAQWPD